MKVVKYDCGCVGLRDQDTEETILFRNCEYAPDDVMFYLAIGYSEKLYEELSAEDQEIWIRDIRLLIADGKRMRQLRRLVGPQ